GATYQDFVVQTYYEGYLHRLIDSVGQSAFNGLLASGTSLAQVRGDIVGSGEYFQTRGRGSNAGFVEALFEDALGRPADAIGIAVFVGQLNQGFTTSQVAQEIFSSGEFRTDLVTGWYEQYLGRAADAGGQAFFLNLLNTGLKEEDAIPVFLGSQE